MAPLPANLAGKGGGQTASIPFNDSPIFYSTQFIRTPFRPRRLAPRAPFLIGKDTRAAELCPLLQPIATVQHSGRGKDVGASHKIMLTNDKVAPFIAHLAGRGRMVLALSATDVAPSFTIQSFNHSTQFIFCLSYTLPIF